jgi:anti-anti-sigma regulatory factor
VRLDGAASRQIETARRALAAGRPLTVDFSAIVEFDAEGAMLACSFLDSLAGAQTEVAVLGASRLQEVARAAVESGRRDDSDGGWKLALAALRVLGEQQAFDDLSIDYCVTYEVSPPSWEPMPPNVRIAAVRPEGPKEDVEHGSATVDGGAFVLCGEIVGRMASDLASLHDYAAARADVIVDCRGLRRLDFVAAGELLNEVVVLASSGKTVLFAEPIPIVEALLVVMGIHEVVEIRRRKV